MNSQEFAAYIISQSACANAEIAAMQAANQERLANGYAIAYGEEAFLAIPDKYGISHNAVETMRRNAQNDTILHHI